MREHKKTYQKDLLEFLQATQSSEEPIIEFLKEIPELNPEFEVTGEVWNICSQRYYSELVFSERFFEKEEEVIFVDEFFNFIFELSKHIVSQPDSSTPTWRFTSFQWFHQWLQGRASETYIDSWNPVLYYFGQRICPTRFLQNVNVVLANPGDWRRTPVLIEFKKIQQKVEFSEVLQRILPINKDLFYRGSSVSEDDKLREEIETQLKRNNIRFDYPCISYKITSNLYRINF